MDKRIFITGGVFSLLSVLIGAFGAHALTDILSANDRLATFDTAVKYQMFHALGLLIIGTLQTKKPSKLFAYSALSISIGIILFSGSLYILSIFNLLFLGAVTPIGGLFFLIGWILFILSQFKKD
ncbi:MAG: uncharacterized membrane protein YgdD (TMEM256/DUF423 family) [Cyclobacteriaceae bacterium]|jgi:uncharacterized membrane protein YgdD (TMEM256/DUF423 family)